MSQCVPTGTAKRWCISSDTRHFWQTIRQGRCTLQIGFTACSSLAITFPVCTGQKQLLEQLLKLYATLYTLQIVARGPRREHTSIPRATGRLGSFVSVTIFKLCKSADVGSYLGGSCVETDLSARVCSHVAIGLHPVRLTRS